METTSPLLALRRRAMPADLKRTLKRQAATLLGLAAAFWLVEGIDQLFLGEKLDAYGIQPRVPSSLAGVVYAPFLHAGIGHVAANTLPFLVLGWLVLARGPRHFVLVSLVIMLLGGLGVWLIGQRETVHVGASGLVFGYLGYLLLRGYFDRSLVALGVSLFVGLVYGSLIWSVFPFATEYSWEGHLMGFLAGVACAWLFTRFGPRVEPPRRTRANRAA